MNLSIIITFYQGINILRTCLTNLVETFPLQGLDLNCEIIIVNDNPSVCLDTIEMDYSKNLNLSIFNALENKGYSASCNLGVSRAKYENILLMDCDIMPHGRWLYHMINAYHAIEKKGTVSATILNMTTNSFVSYGVCIYGVDIILIKHNGLPDYYTSIDRDYPIVTSGCLLISKQLYQSLGGQEEHMINAYNDFDLTYKIYKMGYTNRLCNKSIVYHRGAVSGAIRHLPFKADAKALLFQRWGNELQNPTEKILKEIYSLYNGIHNTNIIVVNFSNSISADFYIHKFCEIHQLTILQNYCIKNPSLERIIINDYLTWEICRTKIPILYMTDDYTLLSENHFWFMNRPLVNDIVLDKNANIISPFSSKFSKS